MKKRSKASVIALIGLSVPVVFTAIWIFLETQNIVIPVAALIFYFGLLYLFLRVNK